MTTWTYCSDCEQRYNICHCAPDNEFEAMLDEPDEDLGVTLETLRRLKGSMPSTIMVLRGMRARHTPRRLRRPTHWDA